MPRALTRSSAAPKRAPAPLRPAPLSFETEVSRPRQVRMHRCQFAEDLCGRLVRCRQQVPRVSQVWSVFCGLTMFLAKLLGSARASRWASTWHRRRRSWSLQGPQAMSVARASAAQSRNPPEPKRWRRRRSRSSSWPHASWGSPSLDRPRRPL